MKPSMPVLLVGLLTVAASASQAQASSPPPARSGPEAEAFVRELIARMTLEEKIAQLRPVARRLSLEDDSGVFSPELAGPVLKDGTGYVGRITMPLAPRPAAVFVNAIQRHLVEQTRLGIPALSTEEGLHGFMAKGATAFPQAIALASTWDPALVERVFAATALEARARGANWLLAPVLDIARDPRWGRTEETLGEDPFLVSRLGVAAIHGLQGRGPGIGKDRVLATAKHFAAHGQPEGGTNAAPANYSERILREQLLPSFEAAVREAGVGSVMASYNEIDGIPSHVNRWLLGDLLRGEWGFQGLVCSDGGGIGDLVGRHHVAADVADAVRQVIAAGIDVELDGTFGSVAADVRAGRIELARIDAAVARVLRAKLAVGLFDDPYVDPERAERVTNSPEHRALALEAARKAIVLLKNEPLAGTGRPLLPLDRGKLRALAVIGPNAAGVHTGGYTLRPRPRRPGPRRDQSQARRHGRDPLRRRRTHHGEPRGLEGLVGRRRGRSGARPRTRHGSRRRWPSPRAPTWRCWSSARTRPSAARAGASSTSAIATASTFRAVRPRW